MANKFGNKQQVKGGALKRARARAARLAAAGKLPAGVNVTRGGTTGREARKLKKANREYQTRQKRGGNVPEDSGLAKRAKDRYNSIATIPGVNLDDGTTRKEARQIKKGWRKAGKPTPFDPLAPQTGRTFADETEANVRLKYGDEEKELSRETASAEEGTRRTANYYDDYKRALQVAADSNRARYNEAIGESEQHKTDAFNQDAAAAQARDQADSAQSELLGRGPGTPNATADQALRARRASGDTQITGLRSRAAASGTRANDRTANSVLAKAEAMGRRDARERNLAKDKLDLEKEKGDFRVSERSRVRSEEREWAAVQKEFKLDKRKQDLDAGNDRASQRTERMKANAQKIIARLYSSADRASARAQVRVAKLQLEKGKISKHQYRTIVNEYHGLPGGAGGGGGGGGGKNGVAKAGIDQDWEKDSFHDAVQTLSESKRGKAGTLERDKAIQSLIDSGVKPRIAKAAWNRYHRRHYGSQKQNDRNMRRGH